MRLIRQGTISLRIEDVCLALLQDVLAEAHAAHKISWEFLAVPRLRDQGIGKDELEHRFNLETDQAKDYARGLAEQFKESQTVK